MKVKGVFNQKMQLIFFFSELDFELNRAKKKFEIFFLNFQFLAPKITNFCFAIIPDVIPVDSAENVSFTWEWWIFVENLAKSIGEIWKLKFG